MVALFLLLSLAATVNALINAENESNTDIKFVQRKLRGHTISPAKGDTNGGNEQRCFYFSNFPRSADFRCFLFVSLFVLSFTGTHCLLL